MTSIAAPVVPRDIRFGIAEDPAPDWAGDLLLSAIIDGFAVLLPVGERCFIRSLKPHAEARSGIQGYAMQEAFHTREPESCDAGLARPVRPGRRSARLAVAVLVLLA